SRWRCAMDAINKFTGFRPEIHSDPEPQEVSSSQDANPPQPLNTGIGGSPDVFETFQPALFDSPANIPNTTPNNTPTPVSGETGDSSSFFDHLTRDIGTLPTGTADQIQENLNGPGEVDWNAIADLKTASEKGDANGIVSILEKLKPNDLAASLSA